MIEVQTHNTDLKKRLTAFAKEYPQCCRQIDDDEDVYKRQTKSSPWLWPSPFLAK